MSIVSPPSRQLPPAPVPALVIALHDDPRPRRPSTAPPQSAHPDLQSLGASTSSSPSSSSSSFHKRPGILRSFSAAENIHSVGGHWSPADGPNIQFAPLPEIAPRKRRSTRSLGVAARGEMLRAQSQRRQQQLQQNEQDLAWEDLAQLVKDASDMFKRVVGGKSKKKAGAPVAPTAEGKPGSSHQGVHAALEKQCPDASDAPSDLLELSQQQDPPDLHLRPRSPPPRVMDSTIEDDEDDETSSGPRDSGFSEDADSADSGPDPRALIDSVSMLALTVVLPEADRHTYSPLCPDDSVPVNQWSRAALS